MPCFPDFKKFSELAGQYDAVPLARRLLCDSLTPVSAFRRIDDRKTACLFESVIGGEKVGRYSFLAVDPQFQITAKGNEVTIRSHEYDRRRFASRILWTEVRKRIEDNQGRPT